MPVPLSLYIHIPWCVQKCPYCDFNSHKVSKTLPEQQYIKQLLIDLQSDVVRFKVDRPLQSIFIGGGTPSLLSGSAISQLLEGIGKQLSFSDVVEITLEANPGTVDEQHFAAYYRAGVNRLSIGIQSFNADQLRRLGRIHSPDEAVRAVKTAQDSGFDNINIDLMFGLPQQTEEQALFDIEQGIALDTVHLSYYQLTLEPNTVFARHPPVLPDEELIDRRFELASQRLRSAGFARYEVSAWSRGQHRRAKHNLNYWQYGDYLGIGAGAHGKITCDEQQTAHLVRTTKPRSPKHYLSRDNRRKERFVQDDEKAFEFMLNALRLTQGFKRQWIVERGLVEMTDVMPTIKHLADKGLLRYSREHIVPTELGRHFVNDMVAAFLND